nr:riboflavin synthase [uncultured Porphyromonas sp.]
MFSGIVEACGEVVGLVREGENLHLTITCPFASELKIDQSVAHNGVCLTVVALDEGRYTVTAIQETLDRSNLGSLQLGDHVNLERSMLLGGRLDGHIVQGHVDMKARCVSVTEADGSWLYRFEHATDAALARKGYMTVEKGSITVNGVSLTVCDSEKTSFGVAIIPYTHEHTNFKYIQPGTEVNLEFDIVGKYLCKMQEYAG